MEKKAIERAKSVWHTALHMLRDLEVLDQAGVKFLSDSLEHEINQAKARKMIGQFKRETGKDIEYPEHTKSYDGVDTDD